MQMIRLLIQSKIYIDDTVNDTIFRIVIVSLILPGTLIRLEPATLAS